LGLLGIIALDRAATRERAFVNYARKENRPALQMETTGRELLPWEEDETWKNPMIAAAVILTALAIFVVVIVGMNRIARDK
jgi:hypothetical protein